MTLTLHGQVELLHKLGPVRPYSTTKGIYAPLSTIGEYAGFSFENGRVLCELLFLIFQVPIEALGLNKNSKPLLQSLAHEQGVVNPFTTPLYPEFYFTMFRI